MSSRVPSHPRRVVPASLMGLFLFAACASKKPDTTSDPTKPGDTAGTGLHSNETTGSGDTSSTDTSSSSTKPSWERVNASAAVTLDQLFPHQPDRMAVLTEGDRVYALLEQLGTDHPAEAYYGLRLDGLQGTVEASELWDGTTVVGPDTALEVFPAGDQNGDGAEDWFLTNRLVYGPLAERILSFEDQAAYFEWNFVVASRFDADGDGVMDVLTMEGGPEAHLLYGPIESGLVHPNMTGSTLPDDQFSVLGEDVSLMDRGGTVLQNHLGPGSDAVIIGVKGGGPDSYAFPLTVPRGTRIPLADALGSFNQTSIEHYPSYEDVGDINDDGQPDFIYGRPETAKLGPGPISGYQSFSYPQDTWPQIPFIDDLYYRPHAGIGDLNGDGIEELVVIVEDLALDRSKPEQEDPATWFILMFSPHEVPLDPVGTGLWIDTSSERTGWISSLFGRDHADVDGDGLPDIIALTHQKTRISVWYGADLLHTYHTQALRPDIPLHEQDSP